MDYYREYFRAGGIFENTVYDGIPELLQVLKRKGVTVALATSKPYEFAVQILQHFDLYQYFDYFGAADMDGTVSKKADVIARLLNQFGDAVPSSILMIGDRAQDIAGAKANGLSSAGVLWGYGSREELQSAGGDHLLSVPSELLSLL